MKRTSLAKLPLLPLAFALATAGQAADMAEGVSPKPLNPSFPNTVEYVDGANKEFPRLRYTDGQLSINDRCPLRQSKLNSRIAPVYVNGKPVGFC